jgi:hypothetical protein
MRVFGFAQLAPNGTVSGPGSWSHRNSNSTERVPVGAYTRIIDARTSASGCTVWRISHR